MPTSQNATEHWTPNSPIDRNLVLKELDLILASYHFRGSKRYPAFLKYVVDAALDGRSANLKERTLGVEVFGRDPNYDTSADPVVRFSASEVRKRIAQYYHENGAGSHLQIELPLGSYVPEFQFRSQETAPPQAAVETEQPIAPLAIPFESRGRFRAVAFALIPLLALAAVAGIYAYRKFAAPKPTAIDRLWAPLLRSSAPILIVVGSSHNLAPESANTSFYDHIVGPYHHVSLATAVSVSNLAGVLRQRGSNYDIKEDSETSLTDLHSRTMILVGATNNSWSMRLANALRFRFLPGPLAQIKDAKNPQNSDWLIDFSKPYTSISTDYGVVARYHDTTTEGPVMIIGGLGPYGTEAASAFVSSPQYLDQIAKQLPAGWENGNLEIVIKSEVIDGKAGPPVLISAEVW